MKKGSVVIRLFYEVELVALSLPFSVAVFRWLRATTTFFGKSALYRLFTV